MQSRRDQVQAQTYVLGRLTAALIAAEPDGLENPNRRMVVGTIAGTMVAALVFVGAILFGYFLPGGATKWREPGVLVVEKETGTRYVYDRGLLRPVLNYASARLLFDGEPPVVSVSRESLRGVAHGQPVGIVGAPDALPTRTAVNQQVWTVCAAETADLTGTVNTVTTMRIEQPGDTARGDRPLDGNQAILVSSKGQSFIVWRGQRLRLTETWLARVLGYDRDPLPVESNWLESVPQGGDLAPPDVPGRGGPGPLVDGRRTVIGELFVARTPGAPERRFLLERDGLAELNPMAYAIVAGDPATAKVYGNRPVLPRELTPAALVTLPVAGQPAWTVTLPTAPPTLATPPEGSAWCVRHSMADGTVELTADPAAPAATDDADGTGVTRTSASAQVVTVQPGVGGLVQAGRTDQAAGPVYYLVTDAGIKYPVGSPTVATRLGFPVGTASPVPRQLLELLPTGSLLDVAPGTG
ncbi:type VII secretion protein EccB [Micromonospora krabiensis]|uniref:Type VII secretion protein EccB n=1 Tax=Micromonospora krabiensis TaxID=307121 RepID=A0A1C3MXJ8_9ACTN|nr:type VII secretion protein EccB [Micromonospora krabiensis]SBV25066.1 type VII secretion protein EccB [Micromonospora krabiensis]